MPDDPLVYIELGRIPLGINRELEYKGKEIIINNNKFIIDPSSSHYSFILKPVIECSGEKPRNIKFKTTTDSNLIYSHIVRHEILSKSVHLLGWKRDNSYHHVILREVISYEYTN